MRAGTLFVSALLFFTSSLGLSPFTSHGEAREALVARNMIEQGNYILPLRNGVEIPSKPPGYHWMAALSVQAFGALSERAIRFPSALAAALILGMLFCLVQRYGLSSVEAISATLILGTSFEFLRNAGMARVDMVFSLTLATSFFLIFEILTGLRGRSVIREIVLGLVLACAVLVKGPAGLLLPWLCGGAFVLLRRGRNEPSPLPIRAVAVSLITGAIVGGIWYGLAYRIGGQSVLDVQLLRENVARLSGAKGYDVGHRGPFYESFVQLVIAFLPWSFLIPHIVVLLRRDAQSFFKREIVQYSFVWIAVFLVILSIAASKRAVYWLPVFPALSIILSASLQYTSKAGRLFFYFPLLLIIIAIPTLFFVSAGLIPVPVHHFPAWFNALLPETTVALFIAAVVCAVSLKHSIRGEQVAAVKGIAIAALVLFGIAQYRVLPRVSADRSAREFVREIESRNFEPLYQYKDNFYPVLFYSRASIPLIEKIVELPRPAYLIAEEEAFGELLRLDQSAKLVLETEGNADEGKEKLILVQLPAHP